MEIRAKKARWLGAIMAAWALGACGGMDALNDLNKNGIPDDQEQPDDNDDVSEEDGGYVDVVDDCPSLCAAALAEMGDTPSCTVQCGVDIAPSFDGAAGVNIAVLVTAGAAGDFQGGQSCDLVTTCETPCGQMLDLCMDALPEPPDPALLGLCTSEYRECLVEEGCYDTYFGCEDRAYDELEDCMDGGNPREQCESFFFDTLCVCATNFNNCLGSDADACPPEEALARMAPPVQTSPGRFRVTQGFIDGQLERLTALSAEIFVLPVFDSANKPVGFQLRSIRKDDPVYALGLRNGDVLIAVNDKSVVNGAASGEVLGLTKASQVRLKIRRAGAVRQLTYDIVKK